MKNVFPKPTTLFFFRTGILFALVLCSILSLSAQSSSKLFNVIPKNSVTNLKKEFDGIIKLVKSEKKSYDFVSIGEISKIQTNGEIKFTIGDLGEVTAKAIQLEFYDENNYKWIGEITGNYTGFLQLFSDENGKYGQIEIDDRSFELMALKGENYSILTESKKTGRFNCNAHIKQNELVHENETPEEKSVLPCNAVNRVRVLVVYTANAITAAGSVGTIQTRINNAIAGFNSASTNVSGVTNTRAQIDLAGFEFTNFTEVNPGITLMNQAQVDAIFTNLINAVALRKAQTNADIVFCAQDANYANAGGIAAAINAMVEAQGYAVGDIDFMPANPVFQHEIGHLFGGRHPVDIDNTPGDMHGFRYTVKSGFLGLGRTNKATLMAAQEPNSTQRPNRWSNPNIQDNNVATGNTTQANVARNIDLSATRISNFRPNTSLYSNILGPNFVTSIGNQTYEIAYGCSSGHTFQWLTSSDGFTYYPAGTGEFYSHFFYPGTPSTLFIRCIVNGADGQQSTSNYTVNVSISTLVESSLSSQVEIRSEKALRIFPNPSVGELNIEYLLQETGDVEIVLYNSTGGVVKRIWNKDSNKGELLTINISLESFAAGTYFARIKTSSHEETKQFVVLK